MAITRNVYGALILNTDRVMFVDVDLPEPGRWNRLRDWSRATFGGGVDLVSSRGRTAPEDPVSTAMARLREWVEARSDWSVRACRTRGGLRYLITHQRFEPGSRGAEEAMDRCRVGYEAGIEAWATCSLMESVGSGRIHPEADSIIRLHDQMTRAESDLPLA